MTAPRTIIIAPDSFKGTASAADAADALRRGVAQYSSSAGIELDIICLPMADGGEGSAAALATAAAHAGHRLSTETLPTVDARGRLTEAQYVINHSAIDAAGQPAPEAYIDLAAASGLPAVADALDPLHSDTFGTGVLIADAQAKGVKHIILGLGGSATIDGGSGILSALGAPAHDERGYALPAGGAPLVNLAYFDTAQVNIPAAMLDFTLLADVTVPALQAPQVFGPQKGATTEDIALLTGALMRLAEVTEQSAQEPASGAAGAVFLGLRWLSRSLWGDDSHIQLSMGAPFIAQRTGLNDALAAAAAGTVAVISGEGAFDSQSLHGKVIAEVARLAGQHRAPLAVVAGSIDSAALAELESQLPHRVPTATVTPQQVIADLEAAGAQLAQQIVSLWDRNA